MTELEKPDTFWQRMRAFVWGRRVLIIVAGVSVVAGLALAAVYLTVAQQTETLAFCAHSCHEMEATVYTEYTHTEHFRSAQGVVVTCSDCHVPRNDWVGTAADKFVAFGEIWDHIVYSEYKLKNFNARRPALEKAVLAGFAATNARACKSCHVYANMVLADQTPAARAMHAEAMKTDANCLTCHTGVAHVMVATAGEAAASGNEMPASQGRTAPGGNAQGQMVYARSCAACHDAMEPKLGDKAAWAPLLKQGDPALVAATIRGKGAMPARGGNASLSDNDIKAAVAYMTSEAQ